MLGLYQYTHLPKQQVSATAQLVNPYKLTKNLMLHAAQIPSQDRIILGACPVSHHPPHYRPNMNMSLRRGMYHLDSGERVSWSGSIQRL